MSAEAQPSPTPLIAWACLGIALNVGVARFTYGVMLPGLRADLGLDYLASGSLNTIHLVGYLVGALIAPPWSRRTGTRRLAIRAHLIVAVGAVLCAVAPNAAMTGGLVLGAGRLATGIGAGAGIVAILVAVFAAVSAARRPLVSAIAWSGMGAAVIVSAAAVPWLLPPQAAWRATFVVAAVLALIIAAYPARSAALFVPPATASEAPGATFSARQMKSPRWIFLVAAYLMFGIGYIAYSTFAGTRLAATQAPVAAVIATWMVFGFASIAGAALTVPILGSARLQAFALIGALAAGTIGATIAIAATATAALTAAALVGLGLAATPAIVSGHVRDRCSAQDYARAFSFASAALGIGQVIGPVLAGALADRFGTAAVPVFAACSYGIAVALAVADALVVRRG